MQGQSPKAILVYALLAQGSLLALDSGRLAAEDQGEVSTELPTARLPVGSVTAADGPLAFQPPSVCNSSRSKGKRKRRPKRLEEFDWCAFAADKSEKWKLPKRHHDCTRAETRAEKKKCRKADAYQLVGVAYADVVPDSAVLKNTAASLCQGKEALLLFRVTPPGDPRPRQVLQARCKSSFPPDPLRAGLNGEFELPVEAEKINWWVDLGVVLATYRTGDQECGIVFIPDRSRTATYGIGETDKNCRKIE